MNPLVILAVALIATIFSLGVAALIKIIVHVAKLTIRNLISYFIKKSNQIKTDGYPIDIVDIVETKRIYEEVEIQLKEKQDAVDAAKLGQDLACLRKESGSDSVISFIRDTEGRVVPESIEIIASDGGMEQSLKKYLQDGSIVQLSLEQ